MARRKSQPSWLIAAGILVVGLLSFLSQFQDNSPSQPPIKQTPTAKQEPAKPDFTKPKITEKVILASAGNQKTIRIASFNIQVFGKSKMANKPVINRLAEIIRQFDIVAIQEIRSSDQSILPEFIKIINDSVFQYDYLISPRLGRTSSKEQYAFIYRTSSVEPIPESVYQILDPQDLIHREPFIGTFQTRINDLSKKPFRFTLINIHTDPDEAMWEVSQMALVYEYVAGKNPEEDDIIILGDLNVNSKKLGPLRRIATLDSVLAQVPTNTRRTKQYDHIVVNRKTTDEFTGKAGVFDMQAALNLTRQQAIDLSDHLPIWAEFHTTENNDPFRIANPVSKTLIQ